MQQHELRPPQGATRPRKRIGRGNASGHGTYSTKGLKGQKARAGGGVRPGFEGGQLPLVRRMAYKRGFRNPFRIDYEEVNLASLAAFAAGATVTAADLRARRILRTSCPVKVLGEGDLSVALTVEAHRFSKSARTKIEAAGGTLVWIDGEPPAEEAAAVVESGAESVDEPAPAAAAAEESAPKPARRRSPRSAEQTGPAAGAEQEA